MLRRPGTAARRSPRCALDHVVDDAPEDARDDDEEDEQEEDTDHQSPGWPTAGCADFRLSSARFAACPSGLSGESLMTSSHAFDAPSGSCLPNSRTMPTFNS